MRTVFATGTGLLAAAILAACGSSGKPAATGGSNGYTSFLHFAECMRSHGVPSFPDPSPGGGGVHIGPGLGLNPQAPAFQQAQQACRHLLPGGGPPRHVSEILKIRLFRHAQCMRAHGVPNYPDPEFPSGGGVLNVIPDNLDPSSPVFQAAAKACRGP